ncbi:MAG: biotin--[acetyl-CoA-carboxylase] ligase [Propionibacteriales bacterium]|nr:biotin--[acetyl-CoA-carboxylase] ligase [Propionibacteriales bacterium]
MDSPYDDLDRRPLDAAALRRALVTAESLWREVVVVDETGSTNSDLAAEARAGAEDGLVLVAEHQQHGRGRLDRSWTAPPRAAVTFSVLVRPAGLPTGRWPWMPLLTGVAVCEAVRRHCEVGATLKWPNDVMVEDRKLAGILLERVDAGDGTPAAVIGVGLNVSSRPDELPVPEATSLALEGASTTDRTVVLRQILRTFEWLYWGWLVSGGDSAGGLAVSYAERCSTLGRRVRVEMTTGEPVEGIARRVDPDGRLVVATDAGETAVGAGDVVHLR